MTATDPAEGDARPGIGDLGLHGGAEFRGDDAFLGALLRAARRSRTRRGTDAPIRVVLLPAAAARERPALAAAAGIAAFEQVALADDVAIAASEARVVDARSAADERLASRLAAADLIYLPGGDPGVVLDVLAGSDAWRAVSRARMRGAIVAGASAGAMALGEWTWTPDGVRRGFGWAGRILVVPHADPDRVADAPTRRSTLVGDGVGILLLDERTGVVGDGRRWLVAGAGRAHWLPPHSSRVQSHEAGATFDT